MQGEVTPFENTYACQVQTELAMLKLRAYAKFKTLYTLAIKHNYCSFMSKIGTLFYGMVHNFCK